MASLPPPPTNDQTGSFAWLEWFRQLRNYITQVGSVPWSIINFAGSTIADIANRSHQLLQGLQGGTTGQYYHLTQAQYNTVLGNNAVTSVAVDTTMTTTYGTYRVTASGKTMTLPACSSAILGREWTIVLATNGYVDIERDGTDTLTLPDNSAIIRLNNKGASVTLRCITTSSWGIV